MTKYKCYSKADPSKEAISTITAENSESAVKFFAAQKKLDVNKFLLIFSVSEWEQKNTSKTS